MGGLHIQCHACKNNDGDENHQSRAWFFPRQVSQPFLKVRFTPGHLQRSYQTRKVPTICGYVWNHTPLLYSTWVLHWTTHSCCGERAAVPAGSQRQHGIPCPVLGILAQLRWQRCTSTTRTHTGTALPGQRSQPPTRTTSYRAKLLWDVEHQ